MHLKELKRIDPAAYDEYVALLVEDCDDEFTVDGSGRIRVEGTDGGYKFSGTFRPEAKSEPWDIIFSERY